MPAWRTMNFALIRKVIRTKGHASRQSPPAAPSASVSPSAPMVSSTPSAPSTPAAPLTPEVPKRKRFSKWGVGVIAAASAALLVAIATNGAENLWHTIYGLFDHSAPLVVSPATLQPGPGTAKPTPSTDNPPAIDQLPSEDLVSTRVENEYFLPGDLSISRLPKPADLSGDDLGQPTTSWTVELDITGTESLPAIITGITIHVISRSSPRVVTAVNSCWKDKCTPVFIPQTATAPGGMVPVVDVYANLDTQANNIDATSTGAYSFPFFVTNVALEDFALTVDDARASYRFVVLVDWVQGARSGQERIEDDDDGQPFSVTPDVIAHYYCYDYGRPRGYADVTNQRDVRSVCDEGTANRPRS
jgi:hypothetical protein